MFFLSKLFGKDKTEGLKYDREFIIDYNTTLKDAKVLFPSNSNQIIINNERPVAPLIGLDKVNLDIYNYINEIRRATICQKLFLKESFQKNKELLMLKKFLNLVVIL